MKELTFSPKGTILIVDDSPDNLHILRIMLAEEGYKVRVAINGELAINSARISPPDIILLDIMMPNLDGYQVCEQLKKDSLTCEIPIIFISAKTQITDKVKALNMGGVDYITKPFEAAEVIARVENQLRIWQLQQQLRQQNNQLAAAIEEREKIQAQLSDRNQMIESILNATPIGISLTDEQGNFIEVNPSYCHMFGLLKQELIGENFTVIFPQHTALEKILLLQQYQEFLTNQTTEKTREYTTCRRDGTTLTISLTRNICHQADGKFFVVTSIQDITLRQQAQQTLAQAAIAAESANRAKSEFLAAMSHELRTPLNSILGFTQLMERDSGLTQNQHKQLNIINRAGNHLLSLINDILEMSKIEAGRSILNLSVFDLFGLLQTLEEMLQTRAKSKGLHLVFDIAPNLPPYIRSDEGKLRQVLLNIVGNAIKFTDIGQVTVRVRGNYQQVSNSQLLNTDCHLYFEIEDTGAGIAPEELHLLFEPFTQTATGRKSQQGTGLGLSISQQFVQLMGGKIKVSSKFGYGSLFAFDIKVKLEASTQLQPSSTVRQVVGLAPNQPEYRILVVDDRADNCQLLVTLLTSIGFQVRATDNGASAVTLWEHWQPHLICMDLRMAEIDGYTATQQIRTKEKELKCADNLASMGNLHSPDAQRISQNQRTVIIAVSASAFEDMNHLALSAGCDDFISKPWRQDELLAKIHHYLGVSYIYQLQTTDTEIIRQATELPTNLDNLKSCLLQMPPDWVTQLHEVSCAGSDEQIIDLIQEIPSEHQSLAIALTNLALNFQFQELMELTESKQS